MTAMTSRTLLTTPPTRTPRTSRLAPTRRLRLTDVKSVCFNGVLMWLWCHAGIHVSVLFAQTLSRPWTVAAQCAERPYAWCYVFTRDLCFSFIQSGLDSARIRIRITDKHALAYLLRK